MYELSNIRFEQVEGRKTFDADSILRGALICGIYEVN